MRGVTVCYAVLPSQDFTSTKMLANLTCGPAITLTDLGDVEGVRQRGREDVALSQRVVDVGVLLHHLQRLRLEEGR